jgi:hypothetical protein
VAVDERRSCLRVDLGMVGVLVAAAWRGGGAAFGSSLRRRSSGLCCVRTGWRLGRGCFGIGFCGCGLTYCRRESEGTAAG